MNLIKNLFKSKKGNDKYLVVADTYYSYGCWLYLFGIFDTEREAVKWVLTHRKVKVREYAGEVEKYNFFEHKYQEFSDKDWAKRFVKKYDGNPTYLGGYIE